MEDLLILVDEADNPIGSEPKLLVHQKGSLHRAFSILIYDSSGKMLIQRRALHKYHTPGLWSNACCSHPRPGEELSTATTRRLFEEIGLRCKLDEKFYFIYVADFENGLVEHELDHVFIGVCDDVPFKNPDEVEEFLWITESELLEDMRLNPDKYTPWVKIIMQRHMKD